MSIVREAVAALFRFSGMPSLVRALAVRDRVTIIFYHDPTPETLERHLRYLSRHYMFVSMDTLQSSIADKDWSCVKKFDKSVMVVTVDDGHRGNAQLAEVFARYKVRPMIYLCSEIVGTDRQFWFKLPGVKSGELKKLPQAERLEILRQKYGWEPTSEGDRQALSVEEIEKLKPYVDFGSHTRFHPILTTCTDEESREEIVLSKTEIEKKCGIYCRHFSFPNGDYGEREIAYVKEAGYLSARTVDLGWNGIDADEYRLKMSGVSDDASINVLAGQVVGFPACFRKWFKRK